MTTGLSEALVVFKSLRVLDLSFNSINLEGKTQRQQLLLTLAGLTSLEVLSVAFNRIHDKGAAALLGCLQPATHTALLILDLSHCFLTKNSIPLLSSFLTESPVHLLMVSGLVCSESLLKGLMEVAKKSGDKTVHLEEHYVGIEVLESYAVQAVLK